jgi:hypothetical protein
MFYAAKSGMKTPTKILLTLTAAAALSFAHPASANLITNPGFETGNFSGWTAFGAGIVNGTINNVPPHSGNFQAVFFSGLLTQSVATTPSASYTIDFWVARTGDANGNLNVIWGGSTILSITNQSAFGYTHYTFTETASTASTTLLFDFNNDITNRSNRWFLDDVSVNPAGVGVPDGGSTLSLLGCALLGLAALRRKLGC